jgi:hypothetical protein
VNWEEVKVYLHVVNPLHPKLRHGATGAQAVCHMATLKYAGALRISGFLKLRQSVVNAHQ